MLVTYYDCYNVLTKVYSDKAFIKQALNTTQIEERNRSTVTKICYGVLDKDITLDYVLSKFCTKNPKLAVRTLLKIGLYSIIFLSTPPHLVTDTLVELCKKLGKGGVSGFINAVLRNYLRKGVEYPSGSDTYSLSIKYSCPEFIIDKFIKTYGLDTTEKILACENSTSFVRFNTGIDGEKYLIEQGVSYEKTPFDNLFVVKNFKQNEDFYSGIYTFQSIGSVYICSLASGGEKLLDCCSAPGGKVVLLSDKYKSCLACDVHAHRVELIKSYASRMNKQNVEAIYKDATVFDKDFCDGFDTVLCDAPCSGTGVISENPDIKLNRKQSDIDELKNLQLSILQNVSKYVKSGGELIYSTCSLLEDENDLVIEKFLQNNKNFKVINQEPTLNAFKSKFGVTLLPSTCFGAGFYAVKMVKQ